LQYNLAFHSGAQVHQAPVQQERQRCWCWPSSTGFRGNNRRSQLACGTYEKHQSCRTQNPRTNARLDAKPLALACETHAHVCGPFAACLPVFPQYIGDTAFCGSWSYLCALAARRSGDSQTAAACWQSPSSLRELQDYPRLVHFQCTAGQWADDPAERSWDRHLSRDIAGQ